MKKTIRFILAGLLCSLLSGQALALDYTYFDASFGTFDYGRSGDNADGYGLMAEGSYAVNPNVRLLGIYRYGEANDVDLWVDELILGGGYHQAIAPGTDLMLDAGIHTQWVEWCGRTCYDDSDTGPIFAGSIRHVTRGGVDLKGGLFMTTVFDETELGVDLSAMVGLGNGMAIGGRFQSVDDTDYLFFTLRF